mmetsp:Transcript_21095/g.66704  ORF Transcript_21095/g.66704 Transcript_21095/m.66704 type:complete len:226 (+) Transcript_21095:1754-2431(+)
MAPTRMPMPRPRRRKDTMTFATLRRALPAGSGSPYFFSRPSKRMRSFSHSSGSSFRGQQASSPASGGGPLTKFRRPSQSRSMSARLMAGSSPSSSSATSTSSTAAGCCTISPAGASLGASSLAFTSVGKFPAKSKVPPRALAMSSDFFVASAIVPWKTMRPESSTSKRSAVGARRSSNCEFTITTRVVPFMAFTIAVSQAACTTSLSTEATGSSRSASVAPCRTA